jgi:nitrate/TMAO reductase-like tetraheme cytochrome c subunit
VSKPGKGKRFYFFVTRHVLIALVAGAIAGIAFILFLIEFDHYSGSEEFCTACHSMELVAVPYRESVHYNSASGVRASCGDCHVSEGVIAATWDHFIGGKDLVKQISGALFGPDYDDPVISALHLPEAAFAARGWFKKTNSATCQRCHNQEAILGTRPDTAAIHGEEAEGKTCIDCHRNLVHRAVPAEKTFKREAWNKMIEKEHSLEPGTAEKLLAE